MQANYTSAIKVQTAMKAGQPAVQKVREAAARMT